MNLFLTKLTIVAGQSRLLAWIRQALLFTLLSTLNSAQTLSVQKFMQLLSFCCWHLIFRHSAGATNHSCKCCFSKQIFSSEYDHVVMPDLTDFFDRKVSKVSLILAVIITSVLSAVVIFHCLSYNFTGRCCYELQGSFSTFIAILWRLVSWSEKRQHCFLYFVVDIPFFGIQQVLQIIFVTVVFLNIFFKRTLVMLSCPIWLIFLIEKCQKSAWFLSL